MRKIHVLFDDERPLLGNIRNEEVSETEALFDEYREAVKTHRYKGQKIRGICITNDATQQGGVERFCGDCSEQKTADTKPPDGWGDDVK